MTVLFDWVEWAIVAKMKAKSYYTLTTSPPGWVFAMLIASVHDSDHDSVGRVFAGLSWELYCQWQTQDSELHQQGEFAHIIIYWVSAKWQSQQCIGLFCKLGGFINYLHYDDYVINYIKLRGTISYTRSVMWHNFTRWVKMRGLKRMSRGKRNSKWSLIQRLGADYDPSCTISTVHNTDLLSTLNGDWQFVVPHICMSIFQWQLRIYSMVFYDCAVLHACGQNDRGRLADWQDTQCATNGERWDTESAEEREVRLCRQR